MASKRRAPAGGARRTRQGSRSAAALENESMSDVYRDMLAEAHSSSSTPTAWGSTQAGESRAPKRRRVGERTPASYATTRAASQEEFEAVEETEDISKPAQTVYDVDASDESEVDDWEDVEPLPVFPALESTTMTASPLASAPAETSRPGDESLQITLERPGAKEKQKAASRRKPVTGAEKRWRLDIHKAHLLCLLSHVQLRNSWCNDDELQKQLKRMAPKSTVVYLNPKKDLPQFTRSTTFADGLKQISDLFRRRFKVTAPGMKRPYWLDNLDESLISTALPMSAEILSSKDDFRKKALSMQGSRDLGAQLFCAMLRAVHVDARLVCSLQPLPFSGVAKGEPPVKPAKEYAMLSDGTTPRALSEASGMGTPDTPKVRDTSPQRMRRFGQPRFSPGPSKPPRPKSTPITYSPVPVESSYPVFWVEAFNEAMQKWVVVDPLVTNTIGKPSRFEPPASDRYNNMNYVIAFEDDGSARDVTRRYAKSFNSKTRKTRVEYTKDGEKWWERTMHFLERPFMDDRDQLEIGELTAKAAAEGMPRSVQDFKNHPIYALERHLHRNEVIHPKREIGKVGTSKLSTNSRSQPLEPVYRRSDVHVVKSADGWYRQGRCIKPGEQPLKRVAAPRNRLKSNFNDEDDIEPEDAQETPMYATFQTDIYKPPPIVNGRVPKNVYGNIDVYVPTMIPEGGFHLKHDDAAHAARVLGIDYADAVTGFEFKGRHGTAVTQGIITSTEYREALLAVLNALQDERVQAEQNRRTATALHMWRQMLLKLRIAERVQSYAYEGEDEEGNAEKLAEAEVDAEASGGGFLPEAGDREGQPQRIDDLYSNTMSSPAESGRDAQLRHVDSLDQSMGGFLSSSVERPRSVVHANLAPIQPSQQPPQSRYKLVVVPRQESSEENPRAPTSTPAEQINPAPPAPPSAPPPAASQPSETPEEPAARSHSPTNVAHPGSTLDVPNAGRSVSVEEISGLPDLVYNDSESENSMLSHDPEDDDAEPEWLLFD